MNECSAEADIVATKYTNDDPKSEVTWTHLHVSGRRDVRKIFVDLNEKESWRSESRAL
jgi:hypothetical protein